MKPSLFKTTMAAALLAAAFTGPAAAQSPYLRADESWITISGTVQNARPDRFDLNYGYGVITVEMDDWDRWDESLGILSGDAVTVSGRIDNDLFQVTTIEAGAVYVENVDRHFFANVADEEAQAFETTYVALVPGEMRLRGAVAAVDRQAREFTLDTGLLTIDVDVTGIGYDPLDDVGYQRLAVGDKVSVIGRFEPRLLAGAEFNARRVLERDRPAVTELGVAVNPEHYQMLPYEVRAVISDGQYTTADLRQAQLEATLRRR